MRVIYKTNNDMRIKWSHSSALILINEKFVLYWTPSHEQNSWLEEAANLIQVVRVRLPLRSFEHLRDKHDLVLLVNFTGRKVVTTNWPPIQM